MLAWGGVVASLVLAPWLASAPQWVLALPWIGSVVALGLPHGAADPVVPFAMRGERLRLGPVALFCVAYIGLGAAYLGVWWSLPATAAVGFLGLTWAHWGQGDLYALRALGWDAHLGSTGHRVLAAVVRGALPMAVPLAAFPTVYADVVRAMAAAVRPDRATAAESFILSLPSGALGVGLAALFSVYAAWGAVVVRKNAGGGRTLVLDLAEVLGLAAFFALVPPLWSVGVYFCLWHALRHLARLGPLIADGSARKLALYALPGTVGAVALIGLLFSGAIDGAVSGVGAYLVGIAALTVPHVVVVGWMDWKQRVWTDP